MPDTSVWVRHLRGDAAVTAQMTALAARHELVTCEPIGMELLGGVRPSGLGHLEALVDAVPLVSLDPQLDFRRAAEILRLVRGSGHTLRSSMDALIAAVALRDGDVTVVHDDIDFERIASVTHLRQERWSRTVAP